MTQLPQAPPPDWRRYMIWAGIWVTFIAALGYAASRGSLGFLENDVSLSIEANRDRVSLSSKEPAVIQVKVTLRNNTADPVTLKAPSACKVFRWQIFDTGGAQVQARYDPTPCPDLAVQTRLKPGEAIEEFYSISLEVSRYTAGEKYLAHVRYWDREGEFIFNAE